MAITGTGTGPFTITGTETTLSIYNAVVLASAVNATKNSDNTQFDFNCALILGDRVIVSSWTSLEEQIRIDATNFRIELNATFTMGVANPAKSGGSLRVVCPGDAFRVNGTFRAYASRIFSQGRAKGDVGATIYFEECTLAFLDSIEGQTTLAPNTTYVRCFIAGATAVAVKVQGTVVLNNTKVSGATYAFQTFGTATKTITDYVGQSNANDFIPNQANAGITNVVGAFDGAGVPRSSLILAGINATFGSIFLKWRYNLNSLLSGAGTNGATVRIRDINGIDVFTGVTASGTIAQQILTRFEYTNSATGIARFPYTVKVRKYELSSEDITYQADNHAAQIASHTLIKFIPLSQAQAATLTGISLVNGTVTLTEARTVSQLWQYYRQWISTLVNFSVDDTWTYDGVALNIDPWIINGIEFLTGGEIITSSATATGIIQNLIITGSIIQNTPTNLSNVSATSITYNTNTPISVTFTNVTAGTVSNSGTGLVTIKRVNSTLTAGTNVVSFVPTTIVLTLNGGRIRILDNLGVEQYNTITDGTFELPATATGTWTYRIAKYGNQLIEGNFAIDGTTKSITASYIPDTFVVDTLANVAAYTDLNSTQKIYDYQSYNLTTALGIAIGSKLNKGFGTISVSGALVLDTTAVSLFDYTANVLTVKTSSIAELTTIFATGNFTQNTATISNDVKIRALNFDSEIVYNADTLTFYPTAVDRDAGTNAGVTTTGGVYRYKFGSIYSGVTMANPLQIRYLSGANVSLSSLTIVTGNFVFSLNNTELILLANSNLQKVNRNLLKESLLTPIFLKETF